MIRTQKLQFEAGMEFLRAIQHKQASGQLKTNEEVASELLKGANYLQCNLDKFVTVDPAMQKVKQRICQLTQRHEPVLITGPTGTGKELLARALKIPGEPFVAVNCGGMLNKELLPSLFFGHKKGSFTGAHEDRDGYLIQAGEGVIFLDEIGDLAPDLQAALLRAIQESEIMPVGSVEAEDINCRFVAATKYDLEKRVDQGLFREDLFARLSCFELKVTGLKERECDILPIRDALHPPPIPNPDDPDDPRRQPLPPFPQSTIDRIYRYNVRAIEQAIARWRAFGNYE